MVHKPVLLKEVLACLALKPGAIVADGTLGSGGHAAEILKIIGPEGRLIGIDQDPEALDRTRRKLDGLGQVTYQHGNFKNIKKILDFLNVPEVDAVILDVGFSSDQLETAERGFSFERSGPLDMRMNPEAGPTARDLVNDLSERELEKLFREYGNERWARQFAGMICRQRVLRPIETTDDLVRTLLEAFPRRSRTRNENRPFWMRRHPATRVFQALRIAVNDELGALREALPEIWQVLKHGGRLAVITFHSLEDRIVKEEFRMRAKQGQGKLVVKKPIVPSWEEVKANPRARSAKLRAVEKIHEGDR